MCALTSDNGDPWSWSPRQGKATRSGRPSQGGPCSPVARPVGWRLCSHSQARVGRDGSAPVPRRLPAARLVEYAAARFRGVAAPAHLESQGSAGGASRPAGSGGPLCGGGRSAEGPAVGAETEEPPDLPVREGWRACPPGMKETTSRFAEFGISLLEAWRAAPAQRRAPLPTTLRTPRPRSRRMLFGAGLGAAVAVSGRLLTRPPGAAGRR